MNFNNNRLRLAFLFLCLGFPLLTQAQESYGMEIFVYGFLSFVGIPVILLSYATAKLIASKDVYIGIALFFIITIIALILSYVYDYISFIFNFELGVYVVFCFVFLFFKSLSPKN
jgi:hypothetical protein